jgi:hypothetical protein
MSDLQTAPPLAPVGYDLQARCGCLLRELRRVKGQYPTVTAVAVVPCTAGHPERVVAGVIVHFAPGMVTPAAGV